MHTFLRKTLCKTHIQNKLGAWGCFGKMGAFWIHRHPRIIQSLVSIPPNVFPKDHTDSPSYIQFFCVQNRQQAQNQRDPFSAMLATKELAQTSHNLMLHPMNFAAIPNQSWTVDPHCPYLGLPLWSVLKWETHRNYAVTLILISIYI